MSRSRFSKLVSVVITGVIAISGLPSMVLADVINSPTYYSVQSELDYEITTNITSSWINHESIDLVLTNTGIDTIHNWYLTFNTPYNIENIWNGTIYETDGNGTYTITSNGWNQDIHTGESVTVGITFSSDTETELSVDPTWYLLNTQATVVDASQYTLAYTEYSAWETGFTGQLTLTSQVDCQHWELSFSSNREITAASSAVLIPEGDNNYAITHDENNMRLFASNAYNFGIQGVNTEEPLDLSNVELTAVDLAYHLTDDADANGVPDYIEFIGGGSIVDPTPTPTSEPTPTPELCENSLICWTSNSTIPCSIQPASIDVYVDTNLAECTSVLIYENDMVVAEMFDDGNYSTSNDDVGGDGIYSGIINVNASVAGEYDYLIKTYNNNIEIGSCVFSITVIDTSNSIQLYRTIVSRVYEYKNSDDYRLDDVSARIEKVSEILCCLESEGYVAPYSVHITSDCVVTCNTADGILIDFVCADEDNTHNIMNDNIINNSINDQSVSLGTDVLYMDAFNGRDEVYAEQESILESCGVSVNVNYSPSYSDYQTCLTQGYDVVIFSSHGVYDGVNCESRISSGIFVNIDDDTVPYYNEEARSGEIAFIPSGDGTIFEISLRDDFFLKYYSSYPDNNTIVLLEGCELFGVDGSVYTDFGYSLTSIGVQYVVGFVNSVQTDYSLDFCRNFIQSISNGSTTGEAYNDAIDQVGVNDEVYYDCDGIYAYPYPYGDDSYRLSMGSLENASFEYFGSLYGPPYLNNVWGWIQSGDARIAHNLSSSIQPTDGNYMAMISTGIGSGESSYYSSSEGSSISQAFVVPSDVNTISFDANLISEEPMEYVGSRFDDSFEVRIVDYLLGNTEIIYSNSINRASWASQVDVNFDGGDRTTYQTGWQSVTSDVSNYSGRSVLLVFSVYDVGDSRFDTAALIDNICFG